jgi:hypothetical protein
MKDDLRARGRSSYKKAVFATDDGPVEAIPASLRRRRSTAEELAHRGARAASRSRPSRTTLADCGGGSERR